MNENMRNYYNVEFEMLKDAHFQTSQKIISFFQYALLIFSAPLALLTSNSISKTLLGTVFILIGIIEVFVISYLSSLRAEALLYARQINRIRNVLYSEHILGENVEDIHNRKILLSQDQKPDYNDRGQFFYIVIVLGCFSAFYSSFGAYKLLQSFFPSSCYRLLSVAVALCMFLISLFSYYRVCLHKENGEDYYSRIIGVDIDGVLNKHEITFAKICNIINETTLSPSEITTLPVHNSGIISLKQEQAVFRTKEYWDEQVLAEGAHYYLIEEIMNEYGYKPYIFTWRDWSVKNDINGKNVSYNLKRETKAWLESNQIKYKKIRFEKGNVDRPVSGFHHKYWTRFFFSKRYRIRFFVEDNVFNARKLSKICEYVFLINHQYNQEENLPYNIIRVDNWKEILDWVKKLN